MAEQLTLEAVAKQYEGVSSLSNSELYQRLVDAGIIEKDELERLEEIGKSKQKTSPIKRSIRWLQQSLKQQGVLKQSGERGTWELAVTDTEADSMFVAPSDLAVVAYSSELGMVVWGDSRQVFSNHPSDTPIQLCFTSPPYPLQNPRRYDAKRTTKAYIEFILSVLEPICAKLADGGNIALNLSNDIFVSQSPARNTYLERLTIALEDELGLQLMDRIIWHNPNKLPGPTQWACNPAKPYHLKVGYEPVLLFSNNPHKTKANNRNILVENSDQMKALYARGGENREATYGDGAYSLNHSSYANETAGTLRSNVLSISANCKDTRLAHRISNTLNLPSHGAMHPSSLPKLFIEWLTSEGDLVVDPFSGSGKTGIMAEKLNRMWINVERVAEYVQLQRGMFLAQKA